MQDSGVLATSNSDLESRLCVYDRFNRHEYYLDDVEDDREFPELAISSGTYTCMIN